ncbi:hypothetical protein CPB85DRAFT_1309827 [Mucidula mucida]|nr:hypothetical protein CPB85DRAFT_1309827 [Mucidula mucida]
MSIYNLKYDIIEKQIKMQKDPRLVHWKSTPYRPLQIRVFTGVFAFTAAYTVYGIAALMMGKKD